MKLKGLGRPFNKSIDATKRDEIITAAQSTFAREGFKEATVRQICKLARANVCLVSYYFGGKDGLYRAVFQRESAARMVNATALLTTEIGNTSMAEYQLRFKIIIEHIFKDMNSNPEFYKMMMREMADGMPRVADIIKKDMGEMMNMLAEFIAEGQKRKYVSKAITPRLIGQTVVNMLLGFTNQIISAHHDHFFKGIPAREIPESIVKTVTTFVFEGVIL